jgi:hypothetical protein
MYSVSESLVLSSEWLFIVKYLVFAARFFADRALSVLLELMKHRAYQMNEDSMQDADYLGGCCLASKHIYECIRFKA